jgi:hypothetical protein
MMILVTGTDLRISSDPSSFYLAEHTFGKVVDEIACMAGEITGEGRSNPLKDSCEYSADPSVSCRRREI